MSKNLYQKLSSTDDQSNRIILVTCKLILVIVNCNFYCIAGRLFAVSLLVSYYYYYYLLCVGASFWYKFLECVSPLLWTVVLKVVQERSRVYNSRGGESARVVGKGEHFCDFWSENMPTYTHT